jgi:AraC-like DNA-binding protein
MAKMLLTNSKMNVAEIADYCGFSRANYFISQFKKQYHRTPLAYRIAHDKDA